MEFSCTARYTCAVPSWTDYASKSVREHIRLSSSNVIRSPTDPGEAGFPTREFDRQRRAGIDRHNVARLSSVLDGKLARSSQSSRNARAFTRNPSETETTAASDPGTAPQMLCAPNTSETENAGKPARERRPEVPCARFPSETAFATATQELHLREIVSIARVIRRRRFFVCE